MENNTEKIVKTYQKLSQIPSLLKANLSKNHTFITTTWTQRNLERGKITMFQKTIYIDQNFAKISETFPLDISSELLETVSPSEKYRAVLRDIDKKQFLEVWQNNKLVRTVDLKALDLHGDVYTDSDFKTFCFSSDENKILYLAEEKPPNTEPFYKRQAKKSDGKDEEATKGEEYVYKQDWGEQLVGRIKSVIVEYNIEADNIDILKGIPNHICPAQLIYSPDGKYLVGVGYITEPRKLGLIYCTNRPSTIFKLDFTGKYSELKNLKNQSVRCPIFTPDGKQLIWLQREANGSHASCLALIKCNLPLIEESEFEVVVDRVPINIPINNDQKFYGLYSTNIIKRCFANDNRLIISTNQRNTINTYIIDLNTKQITELLFNNGSQIILDVFDDIILVNRRNFFKSDRLVIAKLSLKGGFETDIKWFELNESEEICLPNTCIYDYLDLEQNEDPKEICKSFSAIYLGPKSAPDKSVNLIVWPHGGPHSAFANNLFLEGSLFLSMNYALLLINYRGSIGNGEKNVNYLLGKISKSDVSDCKLATEIALNKYSWLNPNSLGLVGGSHGGFLVTHISGQYPDMFKAVVARNPVIDVASMSIISDIPDWCLVECDFNYSQVGSLDDDKLVAMRQASPIVHAHKVKAPTLLQIGSKDLRVPCHQGLEYYHRLKANGIVVKMNLYDDNHPLGQILHEMDNLINTILWFEKYLK